MVFVPWKLACKKPWLRVSYSNNWLIPCLLPLTEQPGPLAATTDPSWVDFAVHSLFLSPQVLITLTELGSLNPALLPHSHLAYINGTMNCEVFWASMVQFAASSVNIKIISNGVSWNTYGCPVCDGNSCIPFWLWGVFFIAITFPTCWGCLRHSGLQVVSYCFSLPNDIGAAGDGAYDEEMSFLQQTSDSDRNAVPRTEPWSKAISSGICLA